jgi:uncharacterized protein
LKLSVQEITPWTKGVEFSHTVHLVDKAKRGKDWDYRFPEPVRTRLQFYRSGSTLIFTGDVTGTAQGHCSRCLASYWIDVKKSFQLSLVPTLRHRGDIRLKPEDLDLGFYAGNEIDLSDLAQEQIILDLPIRPLCKEDCLGLCSACGGNRNEGLCTCAPGRKDPSGSIVVTE